MVAVRQKSLRLTPEELKRLRPHERQALTEFDQRLQLRPLSRPQLPLVVAIHQPLETTIAARGQAQLANPLNPIDWCRNDGHLSSSTCPSHRPHCTRANRTSK